MYKAPIPSEKLSILIAEDDPVNRRLIEKVLDREGYPLFIAKDGAAAWALYQEHRPPLVVTDWLMPEMDGLEFCRRIREFNKAEAFQPYVLLLTAKSETADLAEGFRNGASDFISKPFNEIELIARLRVGEETQQLALELQKQKQLHEQRALTDSLTGLKNRRALMDLLRSDEDRAMRGRRPMAVVITDVDKFKAVNDTYGHNTGDEILKVVSHTLEACVRSGDHVGRWGGEEFLLVLPDTDLIQAAEIAERCRAVLAAQQVDDENGQRIPVSASFGVASADGVLRPDVMELVSQADKALYWAKEAGRNRVKIYVASADPEHRRSA